MKIPLIASIVAASVALGIAQQPAGRAALGGWPAVAARFHELADQAGIVGASLMVMRDGRVAALEHHGVQDNATRRPVDEHTIYHWASITKTFTGIAVMQLRDRGLLSLDDPVVKYVPELRQVHSDYGDISRVRIRHLMSHSAGFRAATWPWGGDKAWHPFEPTRWDQLVAMLPYTELLFAPGSKYSYSNPGVIFLGRIIEGLSGDDYEVYVTKNILMPLGMTHSFFDRAPYHLRSNRSHSYFRTDDGLREARFDFDTGITVSNGGLNAPFEDMAKYVAFLTGPAAPELVLTRASLEEMFTPQLPASEGEGTSGGDAQAALSFFVERHDGVELVGHSGDQNGFISHLYLHRPSRTAYVVAFNTDTTAGQHRPGTRQIDGLLRDTIVREVLARPSAGR